MVDITKAAQAKSDQLNAMDIMGVEPVIRVRGIDYKEGREQPLWIYFDGDNNRPWKPSKGMIRVLIAGWGSETDNWIGKHVQVFFEPSVKYAGKEVGGIQIRAMSDIPNKGLVLALTINRQQRVTYIVKALVVADTTYPADRFEAAFGAMVSKMQDGSMTLQQVIAKCNQTGRLTNEQLARLEQAAPIETNHDENEELL